MLSKRLTNGAGNLVQESLEGLCVSVPHLRLLDGFPQFKVAVDAEHNRRNVALISGGGSGHEPAFAGYVGNGMLAAAVCGDIFAAPPADAILAAICSVESDAGYLLLPINYTGDRLNFGLAEQRARSMGLHVETVLIDDDCAVLETGSVGRRGLAGSVLLMKIMGALAQRGTPLPDLVAFARKAVRSLGTMGVGLDTCALPGEPMQPSRLNPDEIELGLGIHGEPGVQRLQTLSLPTVVDRMLQSIVTYQPSPFVKDSKVGVLINSLGGMAVLDLNIIAKKVAEMVAESFGFKIDFMLIGTFMTSVSVSGFSVTLLKMEAEYRELLQEPTAAVAWTAKHISPFHLHPKVPLPPTTQEEFAPEELTPQGALHRKCIEAVVDRLIAEEEVLNGWDRAVGDGDCGSTLVKACEAIRADMDTYPLNRAAAMLRALGRSIGRASGGTSGVLYHTFLLLAALSMETAPGEVTDFAAWVQAFDSGVDAIQRYGSARIGDRTMLDALEPACRSLAASLGTGDSATTSLQKMREAAERGADSTIGMAARAGRAIYLPTDLFSQTPDPGAKAVAFWLSALADCLTTHFATRS